MRSTRAAALVLATGMVVALDACASMPGTGARPRAAATSGTLDGSTSMSIAPSPRPFPGCPVTAELLLAALKGDSRLYLRSGRPDGLGTVDCFKGFATAKPFANGKPLDGRVLFGNDGTSWRPLNIGSANFCKGYVPPDIAMHFDGCR